MAVVFIIPSLFPPRLPLAPKTEVRYSIQNFSKTNENILLIQLIKVESIVEKIRLPVRRMIVSSKE